ncbi:hypothetical protein AZE42_06663 [Rhizopogon vesiculosus]|uniref:Uncharacterized protein n=1 Tax=Rhizopogon vesiculosus TaxID=180088 RepID=A0A1J8PK73_9AGAM|nr:hypothetical protein AZE42_06663 [Rhizopogon vesiculosus]
MSQPLLLQVVFNWARNCH